MTSPNSSFLISSCVILSLVVSSLACTDDDGSGDHQLAQLDGGVRDAASTSDVDAGSRDDADSQEAGPTDTASQDDADGSQAADADVAPAATLADGIELVGVQAFQTIETTLVEGGAAATSDIPVIAGRETLFRVLVSPSQAWTPQEITARLVLTHQTGGDSQTLTDTLEVSQASQTNQRNSVFEIRVPQGVLTAQTTASFQLVGDGTSSIDSSPPSLARWPRDGSAMPLGASDATGELHVVLVPFRYDTDGSGRLPDTSPEQLARFEDALRAIYPAYELRVDVREAVSWTTSVDWGDFNRELRSLKESDGANQAYYYGIIRPADTFSQYCRGSCTTGQSFTISSADATSYRVGSGLGYTGERWAWTLVHELGHMHGRGHAPCGVSWWSEDRSYPYGDGTVGVWGWDSRSDMLFPPDDVTDFMGYCDDLWVSDYTYLGLVDRMREAHAVQQTMSLLPKTTWRYINWSERDAPRWGRTTRERDPTTGEWATASFVDGAGSVLHRVQVPLIRYAHEGERSVLVPQPPEQGSRIDVVAPNTAFSLPLP
jgi:hypothetical protein